MQIIENHEMTELPFPIEMVVHDFDDNAWPDIRVTLQQFRVRMRMKMMVMKEDLSIQIMFIRLVALTIQF